jgi:hypothetical protein
LNLTGLTCLILTTCVFAPCVSFAEIPPLRTNEPLYQNPFDLAGGGASMTRATQDAVIFSNPSLAAFGAGFLRSIYFRNALHTNQETAQIAQKVRSGQVGINADFLEKAIQTPYHLGLDISAGFITSKLNIGFLSSSRVDIQGRKFGTTGMPELRIRSYSLASLPIGGSTVFRDTIAFGFSLKPVYLAEVAENLGLDTILSAGTQSLNETVKSKLKRGYGVSSDGAVTLQKRTQFLDVRLAFVASDIGGTTFVGGPAPWKPTLGTGLGVSLHDRDTVLHCAADLRDLEENYKEHWSKRFYSGCKAVSARQIGIAAGLYQGSLTFGGLVNLFIFRLEAGTYTREMGTAVGSNTRRLFFVAIGSEIP